jgi:hypothetical protein
MISQEDLEVQGVSLAERAHKSGLSRLKDDETRVLSLYEDWKDGADWPVIIDLWRATLPETARHRLRNFYGYKE